MGRAIGVVSDLIFSSKILATARAAGVEARTVSTASALQAALESGDVSLVIVDMSLPAEQALDALRSAASHRSGPTTVAFYSHVQSELREAAEKAGAGIIMSRSKFTERLPDLLSQHCSGGIG